MDQLITHLQNTGTIAIARECAYISRNHDYFITKLGDPYHISQSISADATLTADLHTALKAADMSVDIGLNLSADTFYGSQGREDPNFTDHNEGLLERVDKECTDPKTMEMESFMLMHMAKCAKKEIRVAAWYTQT